MPVDEDIAQLKRIDPADSIGDQLDPDCPEARALLARVAEQLGDDVPALSDRRFPRRLGLATAGMTAVAAAVLVLVLTPSTDRSPGVSEASAALHQLSLAARAHRESDPPLRAGEYYYQRSEGYGSPEKWISRDGSVAFTSPSLDRIERSGPRPFTGFGLQPGDGLTYEQMVDLPHNPDALFVHVKRASEFEIPPDAKPEEVAGIKAEEESQPLNERMFFAIYAFLIDNPVPADLRAPLYDVAARIEGVELLGEVRNHAGEHGLGIGMWRSGGPDDPDPPITEDGVAINQREDLIFDQKTGTIIGYRTVLNGKPKGQAFVETGIVDEIGERP